MVYNDLPSESEYVISHLMIRSDYEHATSHVSASDL